jgi:fermentation-respiration switch protein FrsA (DUF1100 family)
MAPARASATRISTRRFLRWSLLGATAAVVVAYATVVGWFMAHEVALVFAPSARQHPLPPDLASSVERVSRARRDGTPTLLWVLRTDDSPRRPWVVFLHGNTANVSTPENVTRYRQLHGLGLQVVAPEYPGFGELAGIASEPAAAAAARSAWDWLRASGIPASNIAIYGWSLGSGVATHLASEVDERALVLEGAFTGVDDRARELYPWLPIRLMIRNPFASRERIANVGSPLLLLHAQDDEVIPFAHGQRLLEAAREPKRLVTLHGGHIRPNVRDQATYLGALRRFFREAFGPALRVR